MCSLRGRRRWRKKQENKKRAKKHFLFKQLWGWGKLLLKAVSLRFPIIWVKEKWFSKTSTFEYLLRRRFFFSTQKTFFCLLNFSIFSPPKNTSKFAFFPLQGMKTFLGCKNKHNFWFSYLHSFVKGKVNWIRLLFHSKPQHHHVQEFETNRKSLAA